MTAQSPASDSERRKAVRVRLRSNLVWSSQGNSDQVLKDPVALTYFRLDEGQAFAARLMDGRHTLHEIQQAYEQHFRPERLSPDELEQFASNLIRAGLAQREQPGAGAMLYERAQRRRCQQWWETIRNPLYIRIPLCDPDRFLDRLLPAARLVVHPAMCVVLGLLILAALSLVVVHWNEFLMRLPSAREFFHWRNLVWLWLALGAVKVLHELGHGLACKLQGCEVHEMGILLLLFFPCLYCNTSDTWVLPGKWQRCMVNAAGILVELLIASVATILWWNVDHGSAVYPLCLALMVVCSLNTVLANGNPLMRLDGYYLLSDWWGISNLAEHADRVWRSWLLGRLGIVVPADFQQAHESLAVLIYAILSAGYRWVILGLSLVGAYWFLQPIGLGALAWTMGIIAVTSIAVPPILALGREVYDQRRLLEMKPVRLGFAACTLLSAVAVIGLVPLPMNVAGTALVQIEPDRVEHIIAPDSGGFLESPLVQDGQQVWAGDVLAVLRNPALEIQVQLNEADQSLRSAQLNSLHAELTDAAAGEDDLVTQLQESEAALQQLVQEHAHLRQQWQALTVRAPRAGVVMNLQSPEVRGKWLEKGTVLCQVGQPHALRGLVLIEPADRRLITPGNGAAVHLRGCGLTSWPGVVEEVASVEADRVPPALSSRVAGDVTTQVDPITHIEKPRQPAYVVAVRFRGADGVVQPGMVGRVHIRVESQTLWWRMRHFLGHTFHWTI